MKRGRATALAAILVGAATVAGCEAVGAWMAAPAHPPAGESGSSPDDRPEPSPAREPTRGDVLVETAAGLAGHLNPLVGYGVLALGRLGLGALGRRRAGRTR